MAHSHDRANESPRPGKRETDQCGVCFGHYEDPRLLPCLHTFCRQCIDKLPVTDGQGQVKCPICRAVCLLPESGAVSLPYDFLVSQSTLDSGDGDRKKPLQCMMSHASSASSDCASSLSYWCETCCEALCDRHALPHLSGSGGGTHAVVLLQNAGHLTWKNVPPCPKHGEPVRFYCLPCETVVCGDCTTLGDHRHHDSVKKITDIVEERKVKVFSQVDDLEENKMRRLECSLASLKTSCREIDQRADDVCAEINQAKRAAIKVVERRADEMLEKVEDAKNARLKILNQQERELERHRDAAKHVVEVRTRLSLRESENGREAFFCFLLALQARVTGLLAEEIAVLPPQRFHVMFEAASKESCARKAKELLGKVVVCQASAKHSVIEARLVRPAPSPGEQVVEFVVALRDEKKQPLTEGGDVIEARWIQTSGPDFPSVTVDDHKNGSYTVRCGAAAMGTYQLKLAINGEEMEQELCVLYCEPLKWDPEECHKKILISDGGRKATCLTSAAGCVLGNRAMRRGEHVFRIRLGSVGSYWLGLAPKPLSPSRVDDFKTIAFCWGGAGGHYFRDGAQNDGQHILWAVGDQIEFRLNCEQRSLGMTNLRLGQSSTMTNLPDEEYFPFACLSEKGTSVEFV